MVQPLMIATDTMTAPSTDCKHFDRNSEGSEELQNFKVFNEEGQRGLQSLEKLDY